MKIFALRGLLSIPILEIWNKIDSIEPEAKKRLKNIAKRRSRVCYLSALTGEGASNLLEQVEETLSLKKNKMYLFITI